MPLFSEAELREYRADALDMLDYRCDVKRGTRQGETQGGRPIHGTPNIAEAPIVHTQIPCFLFWPQRGPRRDEPDRQELTAQPRLYVPHGLNPQITQADHIGNVTDQLGGVVAVGWFPVTGVLVHASHVELILQEADLTWGR